MAFILRMKFWLGLGAAVLIGVVLLVVGATMIAASSQGKAKLLNRAKSLEGVAKSPVGDQHVKQEQMLAQYCRGQLQKVRQFLAGRDQPLERIFTADGKGAPAAGTEPLAYLHWADVYRQMTKALLEKLEESVIRVQDAKPLEIASPPRVFLKQQDMHELEKLYWIQEAIVDVVAKLNAGSEKIVPTFVSFRFREESGPVVHPSHSSEFEPRRFVLEVIMKQENVCLLIGDLLDTKFEIEITAVALARRQGGGERFGRGRAAAARSTTEERPGEARRTSAEDLVNVTLLGYVPDYMGPEEKPKRRFPDTGGG